MSSESFSDPATAAIMNQHFVNIKVDREERPDIDSIYMTALQAMTGSGGWPLNVFLLPTGEAFYGGTYFPPDEKAARYRMPSFKQVLLSIADAYANRRDELVNAGAELLRHIQQASSAELGAGQLSEHTLDEAAGRLQQSFDSHNGGFGSAPKFPQPMTLEFLLRRHVARGDAQARAMLDLTLTRMAHGGMYDQLGGGFHRYSVDERWLVPHFEKMLYDNALLARIYVESYQAGGNPLYRRVAEETLGYVAREMTSPEGGFYSSQDADSEGEEGKFFVWTPAEIREALGPDALLFEQVYGVSEKGNFEGHNILYLPRPLEEVARVTGAGVERLEQVAARGRERLFTIRERREKPARDEKVLAAWNGLMLRAFVAAAQVFDRADYLQIAQRNAGFLLGALRGANGRLLRSWKDGRAAIPAFLEDYALLADGLLALYSADGDARWLREALGLADAALELFWDEQLGGFYDTAADAEALVTRPRDVSDNATPSGNSAITDLLLRLAALTGNERYRARAEAVLASLSATLARFPTGFGRLLCAADFALAPVQEIAIVGDPAAPDTRALLKALYSAYRPHTVVALLRPGDDAAAALTPLLEGRTQLDGKATAYVCRNFACRLPVTDPEALRAQLA
jgi:uncharacterized protein YyaL (SSP411 family)